MATLALLDQYLSINAVDLSDHTRSAVATAEGTQLDASAMGTSWNQYRMGLKNGSLQIELLDDFAAASIDATIWAAFNAGVSVAAIIRPVKGTVIGTGNPELRFNVLPSSYSVGGTINEMAMKSLTFPIDGAVVRATS